MNALQRQEPGDPRAKVIEAMARGIYYSQQSYAPHVDWDRLHALIQEKYRRNAEAALAALEAEGWGLTSTREALREANPNYGTPVQSDTRESERLREYPVWVCRERSCEHYGTTGRAVCSDRGHQRPERFVPIAEAERLREALDRISRMPYERGDGWAKARSAAREALSSVPVEEEESDG